MDGNEDCGCTGDKRLDVAAQNPNRAHLLKLGVGDLLGGDIDQSGDPVGVSKVQVGREGLR